MQWVGSGLQRRIYLLLNSGDYLYDKNSSYELLIKLKRFNDYCLFNANKEGVLSKDRTSENRLPFVSIDYPVQQATYIKE
jgi:hypothetical protein